MHVLRSAIPLLATVGTSPSAKSCWMYVHTSNVPPTPSSSTFLLQAQKTAAEDVMPVLAGAVDPVHALPMLVHTLAAEEHPRVLAPMKMISLVSRPVCVCVCIFCTAVV